MRIGLYCLVVAGSLSARGAELKFDFREYRENQTPTNFHSVVSGLGKPGDWRVILDEVPPLLPPLTPQAPVVTRQAVLAQLSQDPTDEHFPLLVYEEETLGDFTATTHFKLVSGAVEQMAVKEPAATAYTLAVYTVDTVATGINLGGPASGPTRHS